MGSLPSTSLLRLLTQYGRQARLINGGTDLLIELERRVRAPVVLIDVSRIRGLDEIRLDKGMFHLGPSVTHNQVAGSPLLRERAYPLARACWEVGAPQIRNRGTIAGNLITASPANDTITPLWALGAQVTLKSAARGERVLPLAEFIRGVRQTTLEPDEMLVDISFPALSQHERGTFIKFGLRRAQAISVVNVTIVLNFHRSHLEQARITLGSVAPTIVAAMEAEQYLASKPLDEVTIAEAARLAVRAARPIDDIRGTAAYRGELVRVLVGQALHQLRHGTERADFPVSPVMLWGQTEGKFPPLNSGLETRNSDLIETTINGRPYTIREAGDKTLLRMLREDIGLTGSKEGCAEGECGACTVFLDGIAAMSCLVPAPRAHGANAGEIGQTLAGNGRPHAPMGPTLLPLKVWPSLSNCTHFNAPSSKRAPSNVVIALLGLS